MSMGFYWDARATDLGCLLQDVGCIGEVLGQVTACALGSSSSSCSPSSTICRRTRLKTCNQRKRLDPLVITVPAAKASLYIPAHEETARHLVSHVLQSSKVIIQYSSAVLSYSSANAMNKRSYWGDKEGWWTSKAHFRLFWTFCEMEMLSNKRTIFLSLFYRLWICSKSSGNTLNLPAFLILISLAVNAILLTE